MKVLVTGASGFLGSHIAEQLAAGGHTVRLLLRKTSNRRFLDFPFEEALGDITDPGSLSAAVAGVDAIVHAAGLIKARTEAEFASVNETGTSNLVAATEASAPKLRCFVYISSLAAHGPSSDGSPRAADARSCPITAYGRTKLAGENILHRSALARRSVTFRMPVIYGPRDPALLPFFRIARFRIAPLLAGGRNLISIVYAADAARAVISSLTSVADIGGRIYSPEDGAAHSWRDLLSAVEAAVGRRTLMLPTPRVAYSLAAIATETFSRVANRPVVFTREKVREMSQPAWVCSSADLHRDLGWTPTVFLSEGARETYNWYCQNRWL